MSDQDWRFRDFKNTSGAYNRTLAIDTPTSRTQFNSTPSPTPTVTAASRVIPSPSGTNWEKTFGSNGGFSSPAPSSPSGTDWAKTFGGGQPTPPQPAVAPTQNLFSGTNRQSGNGFSFDVSPASDRQQLSIGTDSSSFYKDRIAGMDLTKRDHELYGAGKDYGFGY